MNTRQAMDALLEFRPIREVDWDKGDFVRLCNGSGRIVDNNGDYCDLNLLDGLTWELYKLEKKTVKMWLWSSPDTNCLTDNLFSEEEIQRSPVAFADFKKLTWSETEVEI